MKQIIFIFMAILLATGIASAQNKAVISADETSFDFGQIKEADGKVSATFVVKNTGDAPLAITRVIASCGCTTPEWTKEPIAPGASGNIKIRSERTSRPVLKNNFSLQQRKNRKFYPDDTGRGNLISNKQN